MTDSERLADAASALVGVPFRMHGRNPRTGLDCVGTLMVALQAIGRVVPECPLYALRNASYASHDKAMEQIGFVRPSRAEHQAGDVVFAVPGPMQRHVIIVDRKRRFIHAHAGLRRVVAMPGPLPWPVAGHWRLAS